MTLNNAHDPSAEYILILIIHYEIALLIVNTIKSAYYVAVYLWNQPVFSTVTLDFYLPVFNGHMLLKFLKSKR